MKKWYRISAQDDSAEISLFGDIGASFWGDSVTLADFKKDFDQVKDKESIHVLLNSVGGDVFDGMGIYNLLSSVRQKVTIEILGVAASIASVIALAGKDLPQMGEGSFFMIHRPWSIAWGDADELRAQAALLDKVEDQILSIYEQHGALTEDEIRAAMQEETWYTAEEAVEAGFASEVIDYGEVAAAYDPSRYRYTHVPAAIAAHATPSDKPRTIREFEARVRGMGFSNSEAKGIASHGFARRDDAEPEADIEREEPKGNPNASLLIMLQEETYHESH